MRRQQLRRFTGIGLILSFIFPAAVFSAELLDSPAGLASKTGSFETSSRSTDQSLIHPAESFEDPRPSISGAGLSLHAPYRWHATSAVQVRGFIFYIPPAAPQSEPAAEVNPLTAAEIAQAVDSELEKIFGKDRLAFRPAEDSSPAGERVTGRLAARTGEVVMEALRIKILRTDAGLAVTGLEDLAVPEKIEGLQAQLAAAPNPVLSFLFAVAKKTEGAEERREEPLRDIYYFTAEREGLQFLYLEKIKTGQDGEPLREKWVFPVAVGGDTEAPEGAVRVRSGETFSLEAIARGASGPGESMDYRWLSSEELADWRNSEIKGEKEKIEARLESAALPSGLERDQLAQEDTLFEETEAGIADSLNGFRRQMITAGFVPARGAASEPFLELESWARARVEEFSGRVAVIPVSVKTGSGRVLNLPMKQLVDLVREETRAASGAADTDPFKVPAFKGLRSEDAVPEKESRHAVFSDQAFPAPVVFVRLRQAVLSVTGRAGELTVTRAEISPTLFMLALYGVDETIRAQIEHIYAEEAAKNHLDAGTAAFRIERLEIAKSTRDWPVSGLELDVSYAVEGHGRHTASVRVIRRQNDYQAEVLSIGTPFTDSFLNAARSALVRYLPEEAQGLDLVPVYGKNGVFRGASFSLSGAPYFAELAWDEKQGRFAVSIAGDYTGDGVVDEEDAKKAKEFLGPEDAGDPRFVAEIRETEGKLFGRLIRAGKPVFRLWSRTTRGALEQEFDLDRDVTGDGSLDFKDLSFALAARTDVRHVALMLSGNEMLDFDGDGEAGPLDMAYLRSVYRRAETVSFLLNGEDTRILDANRDGRLSREDSVLIENPVLADYRRRQTAQRLKRLGEESVLLLREVAAIPAFADQDTDGILEETDAASLFTRLVVLKQYADRLLAMRSELQSLAAESPASAAEIDDTLKMLNEYLNTASLMQDKLRFSIEIVRRFLLAPA